MGANHDYPDDGDVCHHGVGFDVECWRCDMEIVQEAALQIEQSGI